MTKSGASLHKDKSSSGWKNVVLLPLETCISHQCSLPSVRSQWCTLKWICGYCLCLSHTAGLIAELTLSWMLWSGCPLGIVCHVEYWCICLSYHFQNSFNFGSFSHMTFKTPVALMSIVIYIQYVVGFDLNTVNSEALSWCLKPLLKITWPNTHSQFNLYFILCLNNIKSQFTKIYLKFSYCLQ